MTTADFVFDADANSYTCPAGKTLRQFHRAYETPRSGVDKDGQRRYRASQSDCGVCALKSRCTTGARRYLSRHFDDDVLTRMNQRATPEAMRLRRSTVEHPFATLKYRIFGHPRFLLRGRRGAQTEISLAVMAYNLKRMTNILGARSLTARLAAT